MASSSRNNTIWARIAIGAFIAELLLFTYLRGVAGPLVSPILYFSTSLLLTFSAWYALRGQPYAWAKPLNTIGSGSGWSWVLVAAVLLAAFYPRLQEILHQYPVDIKASDVLPVIEVYVRRFQNGEKVYALITEFDYDLSAGYLPLMWMPFLAPDALNIDYRWVGFWVFAIGILVYAHRLGTLRTPFYEKAFQMSLPILILLPLLGSDTHIIGLSIESLVIGYYFVLAAGIFSKSPGLRAAGLVMCLLSRFAFVFWVPFYLWLIYRHESKGAALRVAGLTILGLLGIYVVPFLSSDWTMFSQGQSYYTASALAEWQYNLNSQGNPAQLFTGLGLAIFFFKYGTGELIDRVNLLRAVHAVASILSVGGVALWYWLRRSSLSVDYRYVALLSLKLNLTIFYAFIQVPYDNLLLLVPFLSVWILLGLRDSVWRLPHSA